jgi:hypothetical protein
MYDHIHRQIAHGRIADVQRAQINRVRRRKFPAKPPSARKR